MTSTTRQRVISTTLAFSVFGLSVAPVVASAASNTANTTINVTVGGAITISSVSPVTIALTPTAGGVLSSASDTVTVSTNNATGYALDLADNDTNTDLVSGGNTITAPSATWGSAAALANGKWGYGIASGTTGLTAGSAFDASYSTETNNASSTSKWVGVPSSAAPQEVKNITNSVSNDTTTIWYAVKANASQVGGTYSDTVTYTATTNP